MSQWTHVAGLIRIDHIPSISSVTLERVKRLFGETVTFDSPQDKWDDCIVPCGSEGSIQYKIDTTGNQYSMEWGLVYLWGDLRNYENHIEIYEWIRNACEKLMIRSCAVKIDVEYKGKYLITDVSNKNNSGIHLIEITAERE